jgi:hypothetical protein
VKWLAPGISPAARVDALLDHLAALEWALAWRDGRISYANPVTRKALERRGISIARVVGVQVSSSGSLRVYLL